MGYDDGECVQCRLERGGNNATKRRENICFGCLSELIDKSDNLDYRLLSVLKHNMSTYGDSCYRCETTCKGAVNVSTCDTCAESKSSRKRKEICFLCYVNSRLEKFADSSDGVIMCLDCLNSAASIFTDRHPDADADAFFTSLKTHYNKDGLRCYRCINITNMYVVPYMCDACVPE
jgi:hypothetical protein